MRDHSAFTALLLADEPLDEARGQKLQQHLAECAECRQLADKWRTARGVLATRPVAEPRAGFAARWKAMADSRPRESTLRPAWWLLAASGIGALAIVISVFLPGGGPVLGLLSASRDTAASAFASIDNAWQALNLPLPIVNGSIPIMVWIAGGILLIGIGVLWLIILRYIASHNTEE